MKQEQIQQNSIQYKYYKPVCLSTVWENWLIGGGIFNLLCKTAF